MHAVDDEERRECLNCYCEQYEVDVRDPLALALSDDPTYTEREP